MDNVILFKITKIKEYSIENLVNNFGNFIQDDTQGVIVNDYGNDFVQATYWNQIIRRRQSYNLSEKKFNYIEEIVIDASDFMIRIDAERMIIFGGKSIAQRIVTLLGIISGNSYIISRYIIDIRKTAENVCKNTNIKILKLKLVDIPIEKNILVNCIVDVTVQENPKALIEKYIDNINAISINIKDINTTVTIYKTGRITVGKIVYDNIEDIVEKIFKIID